MDNKDRDYPHWTFYEWFKAQFGKCPDPDRLVKLRGEFQSLKVSLRMVEQELDEEIMLQAQMTAVGYALAMRGKFKTEKEKQNDK